MMPALKMSTLVPYPKSLRISGATYPGDPHLILSCSESLIIAESPKSTILRVDMLSFLSFIKERKLLEKKVFRL